MALRIDRRDIDRFVRMIKDIKGTVRVSGTELVRTLANEVKRESMARAPFKTGDLEKSHYATVSGLGGKIRAEIGFGPVFNEEGFDYSVPMHEGMPAGNPYNLGPGSEDKSDASPHRGRGVGMKFLKRAFDHVMRNIRVTVAYEMDRAIKKAARRHGGRTV